MSQLDVTLPDAPALPDETQPRPKTLLGFAWQHYVPILLGLTILLAFFLRIYDITGNPNGLNQDEAVNGVDAFSLGQTLRDHHGNFLPVLLESFEDWASSLLTYLTVPFVWVLGLSEFSIRLPVVLMGTATVILMFLYIEKLTKHKNLALLAAFFMCITPWNIITSRWAIPPDIVVFVLLILVYVNSLVGPTETKLWKFGLIGFFAAVATYSYPTQKLFIPMILGVFLIADFFARIPLKPLIKKYLIVGGTFLVVASPIYLLALLDSQKYNARFNSVSIFSLSGNPVIEFLVRYIGYYNPILIFDGPNDYIFLAPFFYIGFVGFIYAAFTRKPYIISRQNALIVLGWWLAFPVAASLTKDTYNQLRVVHGFPVVTIFAVLGIFLTGQFLKARLRTLPKLVPAFYFAVLVFSCYFLVLFYSAYFNPFREDSKIAFQYGIDQFSAYLNQHKSDFDNVTVDSHINQPYIYYLFYSKEDPHRYNYPEINARTSGLDTLRGIPKLDNYFFARIPPETIANATELLSVKDENGFVYYKVYAKDRRWYVVMQYDNAYDPPA